MGFWFGKIDTRELATRIVRYSGIGWIVWACLNLLATFLSGSPLGILGAVFAVAGARACFERSRTATTMAFGIFVLSAGMHILGVLAGGAENRLFNALAVTIWLLVVLSAFRVIKAIEFLNADDLKTVEIS